MTVLKIFEKIVKKIPKNIKFGLQAHINMENKMNSLDRPFEHWKFRKMSYKHMWAYAYESRITNLYIYMRRVKMHPLFVLLTCTLPDTGYVR